MAHWIEHRPPRKETIAVGQVLIRCSSNAGASDPQQPIHCFSVSWESTQIHNAARFRQHVRTNAPWLETEDHSVLQVEWIDFYGDRGQTPGILRFLKHFQSRRGR